MDEIHWTAPEFEPHERGALWYYAVIAAGGVIAFFALWQGNFLFAVFAAIAAVLVLFWGTQKPQMLEFTLSDSALAVGGRLRYPLKDFDGFAMEEATSGGEVNFFEIVLSRKTSFGANVKIVVHESLRDRVHELLSTQLPEEEYRGSLTDSLMRMLRF